MRFLILFLFLMWKIVIGQQKFFITGKVYDEGTGEPLANVNVSVYEANLFTLTNRDGEFSLHLQQGEYKLIFSLVGYDLKEINIKLQEDTRVDIFIKPTAILLSTFEVYESSNNILSQATHKIDYKSISELGYSYAGELLRFITNVNGVRRGGAVLDPVIRGMKFSQIGVYIDGLFYIEGGCPNRMDPTISRVDVHDIERIEVIKGPLTLRYGANLGGAIRLIMNNPYFIETNKLQIKSNIFSEVTMDLGIRQSLRLYGLSDKTSLMFYGGKIDYGNYVDGNGDELQMQAFKYNYGAKVLKKLGKHTILKTTFHQLHGRKVLFPALPMDERSDNTWFAYSEIGTRLPFLNNQHFSTSIYYSSVEHIMDNYNRSISDTMAAVSTVYSQTMGIKSKSVHKVTDNSNLTLIFDIQRIHKDGQRIRTMLMGPPTPSGTLLTFKDKLWNNAFIDNIGFYSDYNLRFKRHSFIFGGRYDYNCSRSDDITVNHIIHGTIYAANPDTLVSSNHNFSAFLGWQYLVFDNFSISLTTGRLVRSPDMIERYVPLLPVGYDRFDYLGNHKLKPEVNYETDLTIHWDINRFGVMQFTLFHCYVENFIIGKFIPPSQQKPLSNGVLGVKQYQNVLQAFLWGTEAVYSLPHFYGFDISFQFAITQGRFWQITKYIIDPNKPILQQVIGDTLLQNDPIPEIPPGELILKINYNIINNLKAGTNLRFIAEQNRVSEAFYELTTPKWFLVDAFINYNLTSKIEIGAGVNNLFDVYYYEHLNRRRVGSNDKLYEPGRRVFVRISYKI